MKHLLPLAVAAAVTVLVGLGVWLDPYFPGDVALARALQSVFPDPACWATPISRIASAPAKYFVMGLTLGVSLGLGGWKGAAIGGGAMLLDQYGSEASKALFARPRPPADLVAVVGSPSGFTFPEGTAGGIRLAGDSRLTLQRLGEPAVELPYERADWNFAGDC